MNMYEKSFEKQAGDVAVWMDELTTRRKNIFSEFLRRELKRQGKLSVSVFGRNDDEILTVRLEKGNPNTGFTIGTENGMVRTWKRGPPFTNVPYIEYRIPHDRIKYILVSTWVPKEELKANPRYFMQSHSAGTGVYIYNYK